MNKEQKIWWHLSILFSLLTFLLVWQYSSHGKVRNAKVLVSYNHLTLEFSGKPIECMTPTDFTSAWTQYAENYCWSQDTYFLPFNEAIAGIDGDSDKAKKKV